MRNSLWPKYSKPGTRSVYIKHIAASIALFLTTAINQPVFSQQSTTQKDTTTPKEVVDDTTTIKKEEVVLSFSTDIIEKYGEEKGLQLLVKYMIEEINTLRNDRDLKTMEMDEKLVETAQDYAKYMVDRNHYSHYDRQWRDFTYRTKQAWYAWFAIWENISPGVTLSQAINWRMQSGWHREIMLDANAKKVGVGCAFMEPDNRGMQKVRWVLLTGK